MPDLWGTWANPREANILLILGVACWAFAYTQIKAFGLWFGIALTLPFAGVVLWVILSRGSIASYLAVVGLVFFRLNRFAWASAGGDQPIALEESGNPILSFFISLAEFFVTIGPPYKGISEAYFWPFIDVAIIAIAISLGLVRKRYLNSD